jgi:transcriptional regulator with XRE-family HTH domain
MDNEIKIPDTAAMIYAIKDRRRERKMKLKEISAQAGVSVSSLINWFYSSNRKPNLETVLLVLDALGLEMIVREKENGQRTA